MAKPRKLSFSEKCPKFFKIYIPDQSSHRLRIPPAFVRNFDVLPSNSIIRNTEQRLWHVEVTNVDDTLYFQKGWDVFVQENSLVLGDFLVFCYGGNSEFCVKIYGKDGCQKEVAGASRNDSKTFSLLRTNQTFKPGRHKQLVHKDSDKQICLRNVSAIPEDNRAIEAASKFVSTNPFFRAVIHPAYLKSGTLNIPSEFVRQYVHKCKQDVTFRLSDKSWPVKMVRYKSGVAKFCTGVLCSRLFGWLRRSVQNISKNGETPRSPSESYFSDNSPEFFKFYHPDKSSKLLRVPKAFVKHFDGTIPDIAILKDQNENFWHVEVKHIDNGLFFENGWENFVKDHSLALGDFLVFKYNGISLFNVRIFGKNGCEKEDSFTIERTITRVKIEEDPEPEQTLPRRTHSFKRNPAKSKCPHEVTPLRSQRIAPKVFKKCRTTDAEPMAPHRSQVFEECGTPDAELMTPLKSQRIAPKFFEECGTPDSEPMALLRSQRIAPKVFEECGTTDAAPMAPLRSQRIAPEVFEECGTPDAAQLTPHTNPYFIASLVRGMLSTLYIPTGWVRKNGIKLRPDMKFCDRDGKSWPVKLRFRNNGRIAFSDGWMKFRRDKNVGSHDRCKFEFVVGRGGRISKTILVHILRAEAAPNHRYWTRRQLQFEE